MSFEPARRSALRSLALAIGATPVVRARAQGGEAWPTRPIRLVVPAPAGNGTDLLARFIGERLGQALGQPLVVDNKPGASGVIGNDAVAKAAPDGYTLLFTNASFTVMLQALEPRLPYDLLRDLAPVAQIGAGGVFLVVAPDVPAGNLAELIALVKAAPDRYVYATWGTGSSAHLIMEALKRRTGMAISHVPYKSTAQILQDLQSGVIRIGWADVSSSVPLIKAGRVKPIAVSGSHRAPLTSQVPTMTEQGHPFDTDGWYAMFAPAGTPPTIVRRVNEEINRVMAAPQLRDRFMQMNFSDPPLKTPEQFAATLREDLATWSGIVKTNGIRLD